MNYLFPKICIWLLIFIIWIGCWSLHFKNRQAWSCKMSLCWNRYIQWQKTRGYCSVIPQLWRELLLYCSLLLLSLWVWFQVLAKYANVHNYFFQVPHVNRTDYQLIDISEDGFVSYFVLAMSPPKFDYFISYLENGLWRSIFNVLNPLMLR